MAVQMCAVGPHTPIQAGLEPLSHPRGGRRSSAFEEQLVQSLVIEKRNAGKKRAPTGQGPQGARVSSEQSGREEVDTPKSSL